MTNLERITRFRPAYDKRNSLDPSKNYVIHCVQCFMVLKGPAGAVHFVFATGMYLPETMQEYAASGRLNPERMDGGTYFILNKPMGYGVGYHSPVPLFEGQELIWPTKLRKTGDAPYDVVFDKIGTEPPLCEWLGIPCYCDGSALRAEKWMDIFIRQGSDKIWEMLEHEYKDCFETKDSDA